jgi:hypothetical protein
VKNKFRSEEQVQDWRTGPEARTAPEARTGPEARTSSEVKNKFRS